MSIKEIHAIGLAILFLTAAALTADAAAIIPAPQKMEFQSGYFRLAPDTQIYTDSASTDTGKALIARLSKSMGWRFKINGKTTPDQEVLNHDGILLTTHNADPSLGDEGYELTVFTNRIIVRAASQAGLFYGVQTLLQLLPPEIFSSNEVKGVEWQMPCVQITDWPRFKWRGLMLDVSRHFFTKSEVEQLLDAMALHKINMFHWHLTDDQGWRIEIKKYPRLTSVGAWRDGVGFGLASNSTTTYGPDGRYGGFYTQDDIREVVAYAAARHITVVPEIEMPGHSLAALAAYPQFGTSDGPFTIPMQAGVNPGIYSPAKAGTFQFLDDVLTEVFQLFPGRYIHIGGDEVPPGPWEHDAACQALMKREGLKTPAELESWFIKRIEKFVNAHGKTLIGWSEIARGGLAQNAVVMDWIGGGKEAASQEHDVVMTPTSYCYFDSYQSRDLSTEPRAIGGFLPLQKVYSFEPVPAGLAPEFQKHILGVQGNMWTEYIPNLRHVEYMAFPRLTALAEVAWSAKSSRNYADFLRRLKTDERRLNQLGVNYRSSALTGAAVFSPNAHAASISLKNKLVSAEWQIHDGMLWPESFKDLATGEKLALRGDLFSLALTNSEFIHSTNFNLVSNVETEQLPVNPGASRFSERLPGRQLTAEMVSADGNIHVTWHGILRDGSRYLRQEFIFKAGKASVPLSGIMLLETPLAGGRATGTVDGSPVATDTAFFGVEHPLSINRAEMGYVRCFLPRGASLNVGESYSCSLVIGFVTKGQLRRGFLTYLERERAHPYRPFLHYNSWYDLGYFNKYNEAGALNVINVFGRELVEKRGVKLDSFLFDDGWDNDATLWQFDRANFPDGFAKVKVAAEKYGAEPGIWLSPWGGYGKPHDERIKFGKEQGFETRDGNFTLAGPKYYQRFHTLCVNAVTNYGINQFKFDGIGENTGTGGGGAQRDFDAMLKLIGDLRALKPDIYINQTTGTWPSPFWLLYADSIWRGGEDHSFVAGTAPERERWITYKDNDVYDRVVCNSELYPLNSLMLHGIIYARKARGLNYDTNNILRSEIRAFFGSGTQLQEMYITPSLMTQQNWDDLAEAAKWSRANAATLVDTHWIGGRPASNEVYGWAAWSSKKGILTLRNPSERVQSIKIDPAKVFELPKGAPKNYTIVNPFKDQTVDVTKLTAGVETTFKLQPFEVLVIEAINHGEDPRP
jgi:N-acetyl-beta-hexosaminidase